MTYALQPQSPDPTSMPSEQRPATIADPCRRTYARPRLVAIARDQALLEVLGPAQAGCGNGGFP